MFFFKLSQNPFFMQNKDLISPPIPYKASERGLYVHVPFCTNKCDYCAFYKKDISLGDFDLYIKSIELEISKYKDFSPTSIFIGGGTPSALPPKYLKSLLQILSEKSSSCSEFSMEVSPTSINADKLKIAQDFGVNRISIGVQSFNETLLKTLGRRTQLKSIYTALDTISQANFQHFNMDFIFAIENQSTSQLQQDLEIALSYPIDHLSAYCIEYESGTALCAGLNDREIDENNEIEFVEFTSSFLSKNGFKRYEISNFAKNNAFCQHNLGTWNMNEWVGIGASAASQYKNQRYKNLPDFSSWAKNLSLNKNTHIEYETLDDEEMLLSSIIFGLRLIDGFNFSLAKKRFPKANASKYTHIISKLKKENLLIEDYHTLKLTPQGLLLADAIALDFLG